MRITVLMIAWAHLGSACTSCSQEEGAWPALHSRSMIASDPSVSPVRHAVDPWIATVTQGSTDILEGKRQLLTGRSTRALVL